MALENRHGQEIERGVKHNMFLQAQARCLGHPLQQRLHGRCIHVIRFTGGSQLVGVVHSPGDKILMDSGIKFVQSVSSQDTVLSAHLVPGTRKRENRVPFFRGAIKGGALGLCNC